jgi:hypothetical protein
VAHGLLSTALGQYVFNYTAVAVENVTFAVQIDGVAVGRQNTTINVADVLPSGINFPASLEAVALQRGGQAIRVALRATPSYLTSASYCEYEGPATLKCPSGLMLFVTYANFSKPADSRCSGPGSACGGASALSEAKARCDGKNSCDVSRPLLNLSDPCPYISKELRVEAQCSKSHTEAAAHLLYCSAAHEAADQLQHTSATEGLA